MTMCVCEMAYGESLSATYAATVAPARFDINRCASGGLRTGARLTMAETLFYLRVDCLVADHGHNDSAPKYCRGPSAIAFSTLEHTCVQLGCRGHGKNAKACPFKRGNRTMAPRHSPLAKSKPTTSSRATQ